MNWHQKGKTNLDFTEARDSEWQWNQLSHMQVCTSLKTDNHASTSPLSFLRAGCPSCPPTNSVKALTARAHSSKTKKNYSPAKELILASFSPFSACISAIVQLVFIDYSCLTQINRKLLVDTIYGCSTAGLKFIITTTKSRN